MSKLQSIMFSAAAATALAAGARSADAQDMSRGDPYVGERGYWAETLPAPRDALELTLNAGYTQGFGVLQEGTAVGDTAQAGMGFELGIGYRLSPSWSVGVSGAYQTYEAGDDLVNDSGPNGATARVEATYHLQPYSRLDPWLELGAGYRHLCECGQPGDNAYLNGFELANLSAGLDLRFDEQLAVAPMIGAGLDMFLWDGTDAIDDPRLSTFVFAGLQVRFDIASSYAQPNATVASY